jgi:hypothetical protein
LGPLLFLISINDLPAFIENKTFLYADDTTLFNVNASYDQLKVLAQSALEKSSNWFSSNGFCLNNDKTQNIVFSLRPIQNNGPTSLENYLSQVKFLGVQIDKSLTWGAHIDYISAKLSRVIFLIRKLTTCIDSNYIKTAYFSYFQSIFRYGLIFYGNASRIDEILILQKTIVRIMSSAESLDHCKPLFISLKIQTIINLYIYDLIMYIFKNPNIIKNIEHNYSTRNKTSGLTAIEFCRLSKKLNSHYIISLKVYNKIAHLIHIYQEKLFCNKFYNWLLQNPFYSVDEFINLNDVDF